MRHCGCRHGPEGRDGRIGGRERIPQDVPSSGASLRSVSSGCGVLLATHLQPLPAETKNQPGAERVLLDVFTLEFTCLFRVLDGSALGCGGRYIPVLLVEGFQLL